uniref:Pentraxin family member n=1 Tax=Cyprinus carpio TaxID=7962 RepID=A0A8C2KN62_CYPCA
MMLHITCFSPTLCLSEYLNTVILSICTILFAYRTQNYDELNVWRELDGRLSFYLSGSGALFYLPPLSTFGTHLCITWDSVTGLSAFWVDGRQSSYQLYKKGHSIRPGGTVLLGQDPDNYLGAFEADLFKPGTVLYVPKGNVFDWNTIKYKINGNVLVAQNN